VDGKQWITEVAGLPCSIESAEDGSWVVTMASTTRSRRSELAAAILDAGGGLVREQEAAAVAASVELRLASVERARRVGKNGAVRPSGFSAK
jgi:hypothetical protein